MCFFSFVQPHFFEGKQQTHTPQNFGGQKLFWSITITTASDLNFWSIKIFIYYEMHQFVRDIYLFIKPFNFLPSNIM